MDLSIGILQLKIMLDGIEPPIWRRIQVPSEISFFKLHKIIQRVMGWKDCHQHQFVFGRGDPLKSSQEKALRLGHAVKGEGACFRYKYDFGDGWEHLVVVEKILPPDHPEKYPVCLDGARACPPEDCGGVPGYEELLEILADPSHPERAERLEWLGDGFDPERFDLPVLNAKLKRLRLQVSGMKLHRVEFAGEILRRGFWLYVWRIEYRSRVYHYVGRTGDSSSRFAASPFARLGQHLDLRRKAIANMLARQLKRVGADPVNCQYRLYALGPIFREQSTLSRHRQFRDRISPLETKLAEHLRTRGFAVLGKHSKPKPVDDRLWAAIHHAFDLALLNIQPDPPREEHMKKRYGQTL